MNDKNKRGTLRPYASPKLSSFGKVSELTKGLHRPGARVPRPGALVEETGVS